jgi:ferredoxin
MNTGFILVCPQASRWRADDHCQHCGVPVSISPSGQKRLQDNRETMVVCNACGPFAISRLSASQSKPGWADRLRRFFRGRM